MGHPLTMNIEGTLTTLANILWKFNTVHWWCGGGMKQQQQKRAGGVALAAAAHHR